MSTQTQTQGSPASRGTAAPRIDPQTLLDPAGGERVTSFFVHEVSLAHGGGTLALITMDNGEDHRHPTTLGPGGLLQLRAALDDVEARVAAGRVIAVGITGKPFVFAAGADLKDISRLVTADQARGAAQLGHDQLRRLGELGVPSFAFINGLALGGGLEVALHCHWRTIATTAQVGLPEVALGLVPGWGGTQLLPSLIGIAGALQVVIADPMANRMVTGAGAVDLAIADVAFEPADFLESSLAWAAEIVNGHRVLERAEVDRDRATWEGTIALAKAALDARVHGVPPAPYRALELLRTARGVHASPIGPSSGTAAASSTSERDAGFAAEDDALTDLLRSEEFRCGVYSFGLTRSRAKKPVGAPEAKLALPVGAVGVVGAGLMASQLALLFARRLRVPVVMTDVDDARVQRGLGFVARDVEKLVRRGRLSPAAGQRLVGQITGSTSPATAFAGADVVIEAVFEDLAVKQAVLRDVEAAVGPDCVLMTNTSSLSVAAMASVLQRPERLVGFHFFNPVAVLPLVEVVRTPSTSDVALATAFAVGRGLGKSCVLVHDAPAFVVNRLLTRASNEALLAIDEGTPPEVAEAGVSGLGLPMGPLALTDLVGPAVSLHVGRSLHEAFPQRFPVPRWLSRVVEAGLTTVSDPDAKRPGTLSPQAAQLLAEVVPERAGSPSTAQAVGRRVLEALAGEARLMLEEGVVTDPRDIDLCLQLGAGWPAFHGGILPLLDRTGTSERVSGSRFLPLGVASLPH